MWTSRKGTYREAADLIYIWRTGLDNGQPYMPGSTSTWTIAVNIFKSCNSGHLMYSEFLQVERICPSSERYIAAVAADRVAKSSAAV